MIQISIIEDSENDQELLLTALKTFSTNENIEFDIQTYLSGEAFLADTKRKSDLLFIDIELGGLTGIELAERIREKDSEVIIIFCTNVASLAIKGYDYDAMDYFIKPVTYEVLYPRMKKVVEKLSTPNLTITIPLTDGFKVIKVDDIIYIESFGHDIIYHTKDGDFKTKERKSMKVIEKELSKYHFAKCNVSYLVNFKYLSIVNGNELVLTTKERLSISRREKKEFINLFFEYLKERGGSI